MIELRWVVTNFKQPELQYRQIVDKTIRPQPAGPFGQPVEYHTPWPQVPPVNQNWQWSDWQTVPTVEGPITQTTNKCDKCGLAFIGAMSYTCTRADCPTLAKSVI